MPENRMQNSRLTGFAAWPAFLALLGQGLLPAPALAGDAPLPTGETRAHPYNYIGLRGNGSGVFSGAQPVAEWNEGTGANILWKTPLPSWSASSPLVIQGRVIVQAEPNLLLAFSPEDGKPLWSRAVDHTVALDEDLARKGRELHARWAKEVRETLAKHFELHWLESVLGALEGQPPDKLFPGNFSWKNEAGVREKLAEKLRQVGPETAAQWRARREELAKEKDSWGKQPTHFGVGFRTGAAQKEWQTAQREMARAGFLFEGWYGYMGQTFATPVSAGERLFVSLGWGQVASYTLEGERKWLRWFEPLHGSGTLYTNSPLLLGDRLIVIAGGFVRALEKEDGREVWSQPYKVASECHAGAPICVRLCGVDLIVTSHGRIYRAADGKVVAEGLPEMVSMPAAQGDVVFYNTGIVHGTEDKLNAMAYRLAWQTTDRLKCEKIWSTPLPGRAGMWVGPLWHDGLLHYSYPQVVCTLDAQDGAVLAKHVPNEYGFTGSHAANTVGAGGNIYMSNCLGQTLVLSAGREGRLRACNRLGSELHRDHVLLTPEELRRKYWEKDLYPTYAYLASHPFFVGDRLYLRTYEALYAIGKK